MLDLTRQKFKLQTACEHLVYINIWWHLDEYYIKFSERYHFWVKIQLFNFQNDSHLSLESYTNKQTKKLYTVRMETIYDPHTVGLHNTGTRCREPHEWSLNVKTEERGKKSRVSILFQCLDAVLPLFILGITKQSEAINILYSSHAGGAHIPSRKWGRDLRSCFLRQLHIKAILTTPQTATFMYILFIVDQFHSLSHPQGRSACW